MQSEELTNTNQCPACFAGIKNSAKFCDQCGANFSPRESISNDASMFISAPTPGNKQVFHNPPSQSPSATKQCPYCGEDIKIAAIICRFCNRELPKGNSKKRINSVSSDYPPSEIQIDVISQQSLDDKDIAIYHGEMSRRRKSIAIAYLLCIFLGALGVHQFYLDRPAAGGCYLTLNIIGLLTTFIFVGWLFLGILWFLLLIDLFRIPDYIRRYDDRLRHELYAALEK
jgi:TM2 domain-containing membrane protein YozV